VRLVADGPEPLALVKDEDDIGVDGGAVVEVVDMLIALDDDVVGAELLFEFGDGGVINGIQHFIFLLGLVERLLVRLI
jgi:hypothetical protein